MINITKTQIDDALTRAEKGLNQYLFLQETLHTVDVSRNRDYQRKFNYFYRIRRNSSWQKQFYDLLEQQKNQSISFSHVLDKIHKNTGRYESSFASKLVATVNPHLPVIDVFVLDNVGLKLPGYKTSNRRKKIISVYNHLIVELNNFINSEIGKYLISEFQKKFQNCVTEIKMVDFVLWQNRPKQ